MRIPIDYNGSTDVPFGVPVKTDFAPKFRVKAEAGAFFVKKYPPEPQKLCTKSCPPRSFFAKTT
jgi:hypothetical protein